MVACGQDRKAIDRLIANIGILAISRTVASTGPATAAFGHRGGPVKLAFGPKTMRIARLVGIFALGILAGAIVMAYLARHASLKYAQAMEISYAFEQQRIAATAVKEGRWLAAASAYRNVAAAEGSPEKPFGIERLEWDVFFPIASLALEPMPAASDPQGEGRRKLAAIYTAMHAYALEQSGDVSEADRAWKNAMKFGALKSVEEARSTARRLIDQDVEAFTGSRSQ